MYRQITRFTAVSAIAIFLMACSENADTPPARTAQPAPVAVVQEDKPAGDSIRTLMKNAVDPNVMALWQAVRYVATADGVEEDIAPETEADWNRLAESAVALVAAGDALLTAGLQADTAPPDADYKYTGAEIQDMLDANPEGWRYFVEEMQFATNATLEAIVRRDIIGLIETGATINNACNGCHAEFWYRPLN